MDVVELMQLVQQTLAMTDREFAGYLKSDVTTIRKTRAGEDELPGHAKLRLFVDVGLVAPTDAVVQLLPARAREKFLAQGAANALTDEQSLALTKVRERFIRAR